MDGNLRGEQAETGIFKKMLSFLDIFGAKIAVGPGHDGDGPFTVTLDVNVCFSGLGFHVSVDTLGGHLFFFQYIEDECGIRVVSDFPNEGNLTSQFGGTYGLVGPFSSEGGGGA